MRDFFELEYITVKVRDEEISCYVQDYVSAKTKDLIEFGYSSLTEKQVINSVWRVVNKEKLKDVIDHFVKDDIVLEITN